MSHFLDRLSYFSQPRETFAQGHGETNGCLLYTSDAADE